MPVFLLDVSVYNKLTYIAFTRIVCHPVTRTLFLRTTFYSLGKINNEASLINKND